jgi:hypothetical protein
VAWAAATPCRHQGDQHGHVQEGKPPPIDPHSTVDNLCSYIQHKFLDGLACSVGSTLHPHCYNGGKPVCSCLSGFGLASTQCVRLVAIGCVLCVLQIVCRTDVGLGEAYMAGDYLVDDLGGFMALMVSSCEGWGPYNTDTSANPCIY